MGHWAVHAGAQRRFCSQLVKRENFKKEELFTGNPVLVVVDIQNGDPPSATEVKQFRTWKMMELGNQGKPGSSRNAAR